MKVSEILEIDKGQIVKIEKILKKLEPLESSPSILTSGAKNFDEVLGGGFYRGKKYLIFGANNTGKTQLCHQLCVQAYIQFSKFFEKPKKSNYLIYYFDTENTFRPERLKEIMRTSNLKSQLILKNILISKIMSNSAFLLSLKKLETVLERDQLNILIIDTINNYYYSELANKNISVNRTKEIFFKILKLINNLAQDYNLIIIATAQVSSSFNEDTLMPYAPIGNQLLNQFFSEYIYFDYKNQDQRYIHLVNSNSLPEKRLLYKITSSGIVDFKY
ncbi:MAG: hypothetical protein ACFE91_04720 [Promethearchaeota archaeon]